MGLDLTHIIPTHPDKNNLNFFQVDDIDLPDWYIEKFSQYIIMSDYGGEKTVLIYFQEKGYQRKGMHSDFYRDFKNDALYLDLATVMKAYEYIEDVNSEYCSVLKSNFKTNFIDNFIEGESLFFVSW